MHFRAGRYDAYFSVNREKHHIGRFDTEEEAAAARDKAVRALGVPVNRLNFPEDP